MGVIAAAAIAGTATLGAAGIGYAGSQKSSKAAASAAKAGRAPAKALERIRDQLQGGSLFGLDSKDFTGRRPEFADFQRVDPGDELGKAARANQGALGDIGNLVMDANALNQFADAVRFERLFPGGLQALRNQGQASESLSRGELPFQDVLGIARDRAGMANRLGLGGTQMGGALPRDLGLSRLQAIQSGATLASQGAATLNTISPVSAQIRPQDHMLTGPQQVDLALRQNLLQQQSQQNRFNLEASPDPFAQGLLGLEQQRLNLYSSGQMAAGQIQSANALATAQMQQDSLSQVAALFGQGGAFSGLYGGGNSVPYNPNTPVVKAQLA
jgi:hypothetical protein